MLSLPFGFSNFQPWGSDGSRRAQCLQTLQPVRHYAGTHNTPILEVMESLRFVRT